MTDTQRIFDVFTSISIIDQLVGTMFEKLLPHGMTRAQFGILNHFVRLDLAEQSPAQLAADFQVTRSTMTSTLARLEKAGLIHVRPHPMDGRSKLVSLTASGRTMRAQCVEATGALAPILAAIIDPEELSTIKPVLDRLQCGLEDHRAR